MAIRKSKYTGGMSRKQQASPYVANQPVTIVLSHDFTDGLPAGDILELAAIPPFCKVVMATLQTVGTAAITITAGTMSGEYGSNDPARTSGTELFNAAVPTTQVDATLVALVAIPVADVARSIGIRASAAIPANPATKLHLRLSYISGQE